MRILITAASSRLSHELAGALAKSHEVVLTDRRQVSTQYSFTRSDLGHDQSTNELVRGMDAIIHPGEVAAGDRVSDQLDYLMRCTYNLLWAASEESVPRLIYLSTLRVMDRYDEEFVVTEQWRPVPQLRCQCFAITWASTCAGSSPAKARSTAYPSGWAGSCGTTSRRVISPPPPFIRTT